MLVFCDLNLYMVCPFFSFAVFFLFGGLRRDTVSDLKKPFITVLPSGTHPDTKYVTGTNRCDISAIYDPRTENFVITSAIDNLLKGASGQAVQIMNLKYGFKETNGLI